MRVFKLILAYIVFINIPALIIIIINSTYKSEVVNFDTNLECYLYTINLCFCISLVVLFLLTGFIIIEKLIRK